MERTEGVRDSGPPCQVNAALGDLNLINIPLRFTSDGPQLGRRVPRRGPPSWQTSRGRPRKRISIGNNEAARVELLGVGAHLDSSDSNGDDQAPQTRLDFCLQNQVGNLSLGGIAAKNLTRYVPEVIQRAWSSKRGTNNREALMDKIRASHMELCKWSRTNFGNIMWNIKNYNERICQLQQQTITEERKAEIEKLKDLVEEWTGREELLWKQCSKSLWLKAGDRNSSYFHAKTNERRIRKEIKCIKDEIGHEVVSRDGI
ncbi:UNVERIFIED_CONTAM: hypothetical protein Slati_0919900 [Sesamum latifolium]|uniref:Uncharacterized protein n=1 Tax=Sesamum latifolium TaxID=2727402 RepID=A0AAW2XSA0_9LAMI